MPNAAKDFVFGNKMVKAGESFEVPAGETEEEYRANGLIAEETKPEEKPAEGPQPAEAPKPEEPAQPAEPGAPGENGKPVEVEGSPDAPHSETVAPAAA